MLWSLKFCFFLLCLNLSFILLTSSFFPHNSSLVHLCHKHESSALLHFIKSFAASGGDSIKVGSWKEGVDCCEWEGITCHPITGYVIGLDLFASGISGTIESNSTLFLLRHLQSLELSWNSFNYSPISPRFGQFPSLKHLSLHGSEFIGEVPIELSQLSQLRFLDLSFNSGLKMPSFKMIIDNLTYLEYLDLSGVNLSTSLPSSTNQKHWGALILKNCSIHGTVPPWVWNSSEQIYLSHNNLEGNLPHATNMSKSSKSFIDLSYNVLDGEIPYWFFTLKSGNFLQLNHNHFTIMPIQFLQNVTSMNVRHLDLSFNDLSGTISLDILPKFPKLEFFGLSSSGLSVNISNDHMNLTSIWPETLETLKLSNCNIHGDVPKQIQDAGKAGLVFLDLSHNSLTGLLANFSESSLLYIDISNNMLEGPLPITSPITSVFLASNNKFIGPVSSSLCNLIAPIFVDFSSNSLNGDFPHCLGNESWQDLLVLNLGSNDIQGTLPENFFGCDDWEYLDLSGNQLQGSLPQSLAHCKNLRVLNLRSNNFSDKFPYWLGTLQLLQVLDLSCNNFYGHIVLSKVENPFPLLQIIDLSSNNFSGKIPNNFKAMKNREGYNGSPQYFSTILHFPDKDSYLYSITLTFNDLELKYEKIITTLFMFDLSNNAFEGEIPNGIGELVSIRGLNLSHNRLTGPIPPPISNLTLLDCLDLSHNRLTGHIPQELASLTSLGVFNVSDNQLIGPIPHGNNFDTFEENSYGGNLGLCGFPLPQCEGDGGPRKLPSTRGSEDEDSEGDVLSEWKIIMMGYVCGTVVGLAWGYYMLSMGKPFWLVKCVTKLELAAIKFYGK